MKTILLVGNGFNYMIENWIKNLSEHFVKETTGEEIVAITEKIHEITRLWQKFNEIFEEIKIKNPKLNEEELIRIIYSVIDLFSSMEGLEKIMGRDKLEQLKGLFDSLLLEKIRDIALEFKNHHESVGYKNIKKLFPDFGSRFSKMLIDQNSKYFHIFTTNYDGVLDTLLTGNPHGFIFQDGFGSYTSEFLKFYNYNIEFDKIICHLHGSYLYQKIYGVTYKLRGNIENTDPVMIFNNPDFKEDIIKRDTVLLQYYEILKTDLKDANQLIIFGNSMINEPHIKKLISEYGNREDLKIIIFSTSPEKVSEELKGVYSFNIEQINTQNILNMDNFFTELGSKL